MTHEHRWIITKIIQIANYIKRRKNPNTIGHWQIVIRLNLILI